MDNPVRRRSSQLADLRWDPVTGSCVLKSSLCTPEQDACFEPLEPKPELKQESSDKLPIPSPHTSGADLATGHRPNSSLDKQSKVRAIGTAGLTDSETLNLNKSDSDEKVSSTLSSAATTAAAAAAATVESLPSQEANTPKSVERPSNKHQTSALVNPFGVTLKPVLRESTWHHATCKKEKAIGFAKKSISFRSLRRSNSVPVNNKIALNASRQEGRNEPKQTQSTHAHESEGQQASASCTNLAKGSENGDQMNDTSKLHQGEEEVVINHQGELHHQPDHPHHQPPGQHQQQQTDLNREFQNDRSEQHKGTISTDDKKQENRSGYLRRNETLPYDQSVLKKPSGSTLKPSVPSFREAKQMFAENKASAASNPGPHVRKNSVPDTQSIKVHVKDLVRRMSDASDGDARSTFLVSNTGGANQHKGTFTPAAPQHDRCAAGVPLPIPSTAAATPAAVPIQARLNVSEKVPCPRWRQGINLPDTAQDGVSSRACRNKGTLSSLTPQSDSGFTKKIPVRDLESRGIKCKENDSVVSEKLSLADNRPPQSGHMSSQAVPGPNSKEAGIEGIETVVGVYAAKLVNIEQPRCKETDQPSLHFNEAHTNKAGGIEALMDKQNHKKGGMAEKEVNHEKHHVTKLAEASLATPVGRRIEESTIQTHTVSSKDKPPDCGRPKTTTDIVSGQGKKNTVASLINKFSSRPPAEESEDTVREGLERNEKRSNLSASSKDRRNHRHRLSLPNPGLLLETSGSPSTSSVKFGRSKSLKGPINIGSPTSGEEPHSQESMYMEQAEIDRLLLRSQELRRSKQRAKIQSLDNGYHTETKITNEEADVESHCGKGHTPVSSNLTREVFKRKKEISRKGQLDYSEDAPEICAPSLEVVYIPPLSLAASSNDERNSSDLTPNKNEKGFREDSPSLSSEAVLAKSTRVEYLMEKHSKCQVYRKTIISTTSTASRPSGFISTTTATSSVTSEDLLLAASTQPVVQSKPPPVPVPRKSKANSSLASCSNGETKTTTESVALEAPPLSPSTQSITKCTNHHVADEEKLAADIVHVLDKFNPRDNIIAFPELQGTMCDPQTLSGNEPELGNGPALDVSKHPCWKETAEKSQPEKVVVDGLEDSVQARTSDPARSTFGGYNENGHLSSTIAARCKPQEVRTETQLQNSLFSSCANTLQRKGNEPCESNQDKKLPNVTKASKQRAVIPCSISPKNQGRNKNCSEIDHNDKDHQIASDMSHSDHLVKDSDLSCHSVPESDIQRQSQAERIARYKEDRRRQLAYVTARVGLELKAPPGLSESMVISDNAGNDKNNSLRIPSAATDDPSMYVEARAENLRSELLQPENSLDDDFAEKDVTPALRRHSLNDLNTENILHVSPRLRKGNITANSDERSQNTSNGEGRSLETSIDTDLRNQSHSKPKKGPNNHDCVFKRLTSVTKTPSSRCKRFEAYSNQVRNNLSPRNGESREEAGLKTPLQRNIRGDVASMEKNSCLRTSVATAKMQGQCQRVDIGLGPRELCEKARGISNLTCDASANARQKREKPSPKNKAPSSIDSPRKPSKTSKPASPRQAFGSSIMSPSATPQNSKSVSHKSCRKPAAAVKINTSHKDIDNVPSLSSTTSSSQNQNLKPWSIKRGQLLSDISGLDCEPLHIPTTSADVVSERQNQEVCLNAAKHSSTVCPRSASADRKQSQPISPTSKTPSKRGFSESSSKKTIPCKTKMSNEEFPQTTDTPNSNDSVPREDAAGNSEMSFTRQHLSKTKRRPSWGFGGRMNLNVEVKHGAEMSCDKSTVGRVRRDNNLFTFSEPLPCASANTRGSELQTRESSNQRINQKLNPVLRNKEKRLSLQIPSSVLCDLKGTERRKSISAYRGTEKTSLASTVVSRGGSKITNAATKDTHDTLGSLFSKKSFPLNSSASRSERLQNLRREHDEALARFKSLVRKQDQFGEVTEITKVEEEHTAHVHECCIRVSSVQEADRLAKSLVDSARQGLPPEQYLQEITLCSPNVNLDHEPKEIQLGKLHYPQALQNANYDEEDVEVPDQLKNKKKEEQETSDSSYDVESMNGIAPKASSDNHQAKPLASHAELKLTEGSSQHPDPEAGIVLKDVPNVRTLHFHPMICVPAQKESFLSERSNIKDNCLYKTSSDSIAHDITSANSPEENLKSEDWLGSQIGPLSSESPRTTNQTDDVSSTKVNTSFTDSTPLTPANGEKHFETTASGVIDTSCACVGAPNSVDNDNTGFHVVQKWSPRSAIPVLLVPDGESDEGVYIQSDLHSQCPEAPTELDEMHSKRNIPASPIDVSSLDKQAVSEKADMTVAVEKTAVLSHERNSPNISTCDSCHDEDKETAPEPTEKTKELHRAAEKCFTLFSEQGERLVEVSPSILESKPVNQVVLKCEKEASLCPNLDDDGNAYKAATADLLGKSKVIVKEKQSKGLEHDLNVDNELKDQSCVNVIGVAHASAGPCDQIPPQDNSSVFSTQIAKHSEDSTSKLIENTCIDSLHKDVSSTTNVPLYRMNPTLDDISSCLSKPADPNQEELTFGLECRQNNGFYEAPIRSNVFSYCDDSKKESSIEVSGDSEYQSAVEGIPEDSLLLENKEKSPGLIQKDEESKQEQVRTVNSVGPTQYPVSSSIAQKVNAYLNCVTQSNCSLQRPPEVKPSCKEASSLRSHTFIKSEAQVNKEGDSPENITKRLLDEPPGASECVSSLPGYRIQKDMSSQTTEDETPGIKLKHTSSQTMCHTSKDVGTENPASGPNLHAKRTTKPRATNILQGQSVQVLASTLNKVVNGTTEGQTPVMDERHVFTSTPEDGMALKHLRTKTEKCTPAESESISRNATFIKNDIIGITKPDQLSIFGKTLINQCRGDAENICHEEANNSDIAPLKKNITPNGAHELTASNKKWFGKSAEMSVAESRHDDHTKESKGNLEHVSSSSSHLVEMTSSISREQSSPFAMSLAKTVPNEQKCFGVPLDVHSPGFQQSHLNDKAISTENDPSPASTTRNSNLMTCSNIQTEQNVSPRNPLRKSTSKSKTSEISKTLDSHARTRSSSVELPSAKISASQINLDTLINDLDLSSDSFDSLFLQNAIYLKGASSAAAADAKTKRARTKFGFSVPNSILKRRKSASSALSGRADSDQAQKLLPSTRPLPRRRSMLAEGQGRIREVLACWGEELIPSRGEASR
ncbi:hypothetical protein PoB_002640600 [Plakobranchus ocellatus]|uniref:HP domain-containing protein n=1 Tax=Plakobranchus ocellatus TaxID=259542 RepID=A0AAV3ZVC8_9GAST|nr:hypothetical protein PoB_002640600 [Plakobranchus ocellatus]